MIDSLFESVKLSWLILVSVVNSREIKDRAQQNRQTKTLYSKIWHGQDLVKIQHSINSTENLSKIQHSVNTEQQYTSARYFIAQIRCGNPQQDRAQCKYSIESLSKIQYSADTAQQATSARYSIAQIRHGDSQQDKAQRRHSSASHVSKIHHGADLPSFPYAIICANIPSPTSHKRMQCNQCELVMIS